MEIGFIDNVVPCCKICNRAKNNMDQMEFIEWARKVTNHTVCLPMAEQRGGEIDHFRDPTEMV